MCTIYRYPNILMFETKYLDGIGGLPEIVNNEYVPYAVSTEKAIIYIKV